MRIADKHGLVGAGSGPKSFLARLPSLQRRIGPIRGVTYSTARKLTLALRCGFAVPNYGALEFCPVIWILVPEPALEQVLRDLVTEVPMRKTVLVICETTRASQDFDFLKGARVATLNAIDDTRKSAFLAEGHRDALRMVRKTVEQERRKLIEIRADAKAGYLAAVQLMTDLMRALVTSAIQCLQAAGVSRPEALDMVTQLAGQTVKAQGRAGAKPWSKSELQEFRNDLRQRVDELRAICPVESEVYASAAALALEYFERLSAPKKVRRYHA